MKTDDVAKYAEMTAALVPLAFELAERVCTIGEHLKADGIKVPGIEELEAVRDRLAELPSLTPKKDGV